MVADDDAPAEPAGSRTPTRSDPGVDPQPPPQAGRPHDEGRDWAVGTHLAGLAWLVGVPGIVGVLILWLVKRDEHEIVDRHGREAMNFQLSLLIYGAIGFVLVFVLVGFAVLAIVALLGLVFPIVAAVKTSDGHDYEYPLTIRLLGGPQPGTTASGR